MWDVGENLKEEQTLTNRIKLDQRPQRITPRTTSSHSLRCCLVCEEEERVGKGGEGVAVGYVC